MFSRPGTYPAPRKRSTDSDRYAARAAARTRRITAAGAVIAQLPDTWTPADVVAVLEQAGITSLDFMEMDSRPGAYYLSGAWHPRLRLTRNAPDSGLFEMFERTNETAEQAAEQGAEREYRKLRSR
jgi:hypothetical protein